MGRKKALTDFVLKVQHMLLAILAITMSLYRDPLPKARIQARRSTLMVFREFQGLACEDLQRVQMGLPFTGPYAAAAAIEQYLFNTQWSLMEPQGISWVEQSMNFSLHHAVHDVLGFGVASPSLAAR